MQKEYFQSLYQYNKWANDKVLDVFLKQDTVPEKSLLWMSHIIAAEKAWFSRIVNEDFGAFKLWESVELPELKELQLKFDGLYINHVSSKEDFESFISYKNTKGEAHETKLSDILIHVANHGTYHRGQISANLKENGIQPVSTDFIFWKRETI